MSLWEAIQGWSQQKIEIKAPPPWDKEGPYFATPCTLEDAAKVRKAITQPDSPEEWGRLVWAKLVNESGQRIFESVPWLEFQRRMPPDVAQIMGQQIYFAGTNQTVEEARKN